MSPTERRKWIASLDAQYNPCDSGLHICAVDEEAEHGPFVTVENLPLPAAAAQAIFEAAKAELGEKEGGDFNVDLMIDTYHLDDFRMNRQMLDRLKRMVSAARAPA